MREIAVDTETTGLDPQSGDRMVEVGSVELENGVPTGRHYQTYINPERDMPDGAFRVHGLSAEFLSDKPLFRDVADDFLAFIGDDVLVIHNAGFDIGFLNMELARIDRPPIVMDRVVDTLAMARRKFPGAQASLDALCRRFAIDLSARTRHGALLDAELLAEVYLELTGGRQPDLTLAHQEASPAPRVAVDGVAAAREKRPARPHAPTTAEAAAHEAFLAQLDDPLWKR